MQSPKFSNFTGIIVREKSYKPFGEATINVEQITCISLHQEVYP